MGKISYIADGLKNLVSNLGTDRDKASHSIYTVDIITPQMLQEMYRGAWLPRKVVDVVANDACRNWRAWTGDAAQVAAMAKREKELNVRGNVLEALQKARLFGGAAVYIGTDSTDVMAPLQLTETIQHLTVISSNHLVAGTIERDPTSPYFGKPGRYTISEGAAVIHPSRLIVLYGTKIPDESLVTKAFAQGWGDSVLLSIRDAILSADSTVANVASLVFEAKVDVIKIPDFMASLDDPEYEEKVLKRTSLAMTAKGINGALLIDAAEDYQQKSASFGNLKEIMLAMMQVVSGASDIPMTRLLGMAPGGLNSTGEGDTRNYYDHISAIQELQISPAMALFDKLLAANVLGETNSGAAVYEWSGLWQSTASEDADIGNKVAETIKKLSDTELYDPDALAAASVAVLTEKNVMPGLEAASFEDDGASDDDAGSTDEDDAMFSDGVARPLYVSRKVLNVKDIKTWAKKQGIELLADLHVTVAHSRDAVDWMAVAPSWDGDTDGKMHIEPGGPRDLTIQGDDPVLVIEFASRSLQWRHEAIREAGASWDFDSYQPHISVAMASTNALDGLTPYQGPIVLGPEIFEDLNA